MIKDLGELKKLLRLCRSHGVSEIDLGLVKLKFGEMPAEPINENTDELTPEQLAFYSSGGFQQGDLMGPEQ